MQGPSAATIAARRAPSRSIAATVASMIPLSAPFHPACAAPTTRASGSAKRIMPQSAPVTPSAKPGVAVATPSQRGRLPGVPRACEDERVGRMDLVWHGESVGRDAERFRHPRAVRRHRLGRVARPHAAVERRIDAVRNPAGRVKKAWATPGSSSVLAVRNGTALKPVSPPPGDGSPAARQAPDWRSP